MVPTTLLNVLDQKPFLKEISNLYEKNGLQIYLVGGAVRDGILGIDTKDFDFTTNANPEDSIKILNKNDYKTTEIGKAFGTIETTVEEYSLHITTYREDEYNKNSRKPEIKTSLKIIISAAIKE